jgi:hypothetical protein
MAPFAQTEWVPSHLCQSRQPAVAQPCGLGDLDEQQGRLRGGYSSGTLGFDAVPIDVIPGGLVWGPRFTTRNSRYAYNSRSHDQTKTLELEI